MSLAKRSRKLLSLDVSWCRRISNEALGLIVDCCSSLKLLKIFGCRQVRALRATTIIIFSNYVSLGTSMYGPKLHG